MAVFDFGNERAQNLGDAKYDKDAVNLRTLNRSIDGISGGTSGGPFLPLAGGTVTGNTTFQFILSGKVLLSGSTNLYDIFSRLGHHHVTSDINDIQTYLNQKADLTGATFTGNVFIPGLTSNTFVSTSISANTISGSTLYSGSTDLSTIIHDAVGSGSTFFNAGPTPVTVGGIVAGSTFSPAKTMQQMWNQLLYPYQNPAFSSFSIAGQSTTIEVGDTVVGGLRTFTWSTTNSGNVSGNSISISDNSSGITLSSGLANDGTENITITATTLSSSGSHVWGISGVNTNSVNFSSTFTVNWRFRIYYGTSLITPLVEADIESLSNNPLASSFAGTYSFVAGGYKYFCYPSSMGTATIFKDTATNLNVAMEPHYIVSVTNIFGATTNYRVHRTTNILGGSINIQIS